MGIKIEKKQRITMEKTVIFKTMTLQKEHKEVGFNLILL
jgi:hypothetical protein